MKVIRSSGFRRISLGLTAVLAAVLIDYVVMAVDILFLDTDSPVSSVSDILLGGVRFLAWLLILAGLTECAEENVHLNRAKLTVVIYLVMSGICIGLDSLRLYLREIGAENDIYTIVSSVVEFLTNTATLFAVLDIVRGFGQAWYDCGGDEETGRRIVSARRRYAVSMAACVLTAAVLCSLLVLVYITAPELSDGTVTGIGVAVAICVVAAVPLQIWSTVDFCRIVRLCRRVVRIIDEISGG